MCKRKIKLENFQSYKLVFRENYWRKERERLKEQREKRMTADLPYDIYPYSHKYLKRNK